MGQIISIQDVLDRVGVNVNSTISASTAQLERWIATAEGVVVAETRINWLTGSGSMTSEVKQEFRTCAACHAAIRVIQQDMSGFTSRGEATTMLNVNDKEFQRSLRALKDIDANKPRSVPTG